MNALFLLPGSQNCNDPLQKSGLFDFCLLIETVTVFITICFYPALRGLHVFILFITDRFVDVHNIYLPYVEPAGLTDVCCLLFSKNIITETVSVPIGCILKYPCAICAGSTNRG